MKQLNARISENKRIAQGFYKMRLGSAYLAKNSKPGQFVEIKCSKGHEVLLRRPLGVHRILSGGIEVLYEVIGKGTELLSRKRPGDTIDVIGPLGNGFSIKRTTNNACPTKPEGRRREQRTTILIAGGMGVAPLVALAEDLRKNKYDVTAMIGAKTKARILCEGEFKALGCFVSVATEDGSNGRKGLVTDLLRSTQYAVRSTIYACGPNPMLKAVAKIAENHGIPCQVSLEERMACGVGVCLGCPVRVRTAYSVQRTASTQYEYKMVCKDGPVFDAKEIAW
jgi:dihydroorotate dehydrogenase electron transfer subunit